MNPEETNKDAEEALERHMSIMRLRIINTIDRMLGKLQVACCLVKLIENDGSAIAHLYDTEELNAILVPCNRYKAENELQESLFSVSTIRRKNLSSIDSRIDPKLTAVIHNLYKNDKIRNFSECYSEKITGPCKDFLSTMIDLRNLIYKKLYTTSTEQIQFEKKLGRLWKQNEFYKGKIAVREKKCDKLDQDMRTTLYDKNRTVSYYTSLLENMWENNEKEKMKIINLSERTMASNNATSLERTEELGEKAKEITQQYEALVEKHMKTEKDMRKKRYKVETQLVNWLSKYDTDIGELQRKLEVETDGFAEEKDLMDNLEERHTIQEEQYIILMHEKAIEEQRLFDLKLVAFIRLISAKKIQKWWRKVLAIINKYRAKAKKGKKGKKK